MTSTRAWLPKKDPWMPGDYDEPVIWAVRAFSKGAATESQQRLLWDWMHYLAGLGDEFADLVYRPGDSGDRDTVFASAKQWPLLQMRKLLRPELTPRGPVEQARPTDNPAKPARKKRSPRVKRTR